MAELQTIFVRRKLDRISQLITAANSLPENDRKRLLTDMSKDLKAIAKRVDEIIAGKKEYILL